MGGKIRRACALIGTTAFILFAWICVEGHRERFRQNDLPDDQIGQTLPIWILGSAATESTAGTDSCVAPGVLTLHRQRWLRPTANSGESAPLCVHSAGRQDVPRKCLVEFSARMPNGYRMDSVASRLTGFYYRIRYGGLLYFTADESDHLFLMLDHRWCEWMDAGRGFRLANNEAS